MSWTPERTETLRRLWLDGVDARTIATQLGGVTRNAVIGKANRLGLARPPSHPRVSPFRPLTVEDKLPGETTAAFRKRAKKHQAMMAVARTKSVKDLQDLLMDWIENDTIKFP